MLKELLADSTVWGGYLAIWKVIIFVLLFGLWAWVGQWMDKDAPVVQTNRTFWNNIYLGTGVAALLLWLMLPAPFIVDMLLFLVIWLTVSITYVLHRNARVERDQRILTPERIRFVLSREGQERPVEQRMVFVSVHGNDLPIPHRQDEEYSGDVASEELIFEFWSRRVSLAELMPTGENYQLRYVIDGMVGMAGDRDREETADIVLQEISLERLSDRKALLASLDQPRPDAVPAAG